MNVHTTRGRTALALLLIYVILLAVAGLNPRNLPRGNAVGWLADQPGIRFDGHGLAYTAALGNGMTENAFAEFSLLVDLQLVSAGGRRGFEHVVTFFGDESASQLLVGQWQQSLIVTNGADYDYRQRRPRLSAALDPDDRRWHLLVVTADATGTRLFLDDREAGAMTEQLTLPAADGDFRLLLGNSVHGNRGWSGLIRGVALLSRSLDPAEIRDLAGRHGEVSSFDQLSLEHPALLFAFTEGRGRQSVDLGGRMRTLSFPPEPVILRPEFFQPGFRDARLLDVLVNLFGFVPLGVLGVLVLRSRTAAPSGAVLAIVVGFGVALSACIELAQAWMLMRSSSLLDLLLNSAGTLSGALAGLASGPRLERLLEPPSQRGS